MAFNLRPALAVTYTVEDKSGSSTCGFYMRLGAPVGDTMFGLDIPDPDFGTFLSEFAASLQNVTDCRVTGYSVTLSWIQDTLPAFTGDPNVERKGVLQFQTEDGFQSIFTIPGIKSSAIGADGINIIRDPNTPGQFTGNPLETHLESIHDKLVNGATVDLATAPVVDRRNADLVLLLDAYQQHRANRRG